MLGEVVGFVDGGTLRSIVGIADGPCDGERLIEGTSLGRKEGVEVGM